MDIEFGGAAREVTGSCHLLRVGRRLVLLDCGLFQGHRREADARNRHLPFAIDDVDAVIVSHAHLDHAGRLPYLVRRGFRGPIHATSATRDLCEVMLADSAHIQEEDARFLRRRRRVPVEPLYERRDVERTIRLVKARRYDDWFDVVPGVRARLTDAGHILGSASIVVEAEENGHAQRLVFSGDVGRAGLSIVRDPEPPADGADLVIMESTYGDRDHESVADARQRLATVVRETAARGGRVLVPAFALGRAQEILYDLHILSHEGAIPAIPIWVDSPLASETTDFFDRHPELFDRSERLVRTDRHLFHFERVAFTSSVEESKRLNAATGPMVIIAGSGMAESGRIVHHLREGAGDPRNTVLIVGYQAAHTAGRRIVERQPELRLLGDVVPLRARVEVIGGYSAHADRTELVDWLAAVSAGSPTRPRVALVHGEPAAQDSLAARLRTDGYDVRCPEPGERLALDTTHAAESR